MKGWRHGGNVWQVAAELGYLPEEIIDFSSSLNPLGPPEWVYSVIDRIKSKIIHYPDPFCSELRDRIARSFGISQSEILPGNGTSELLYLLPRALNSSRAVIPVPSYVDYEYSARAAGLAVLNIPMQAHCGFRFPIEQLRTVLRPGDIVYIGRPNNPTGDLCDGKEIRSMALDNTEVHFAVDQAFYDFVQDRDPLLKGRPKNVILFFSLTKILAVPGIRIGWIVADPPLIERLKQLQAPWSVNVLAQAIGEKAFDHREDIEQVIRTIAEARMELFKMMKELGVIRVFPSKVNYLLCEIHKDGMNASLLQDRLLREHKILIRRCDNFASLNEMFFRVCVRSAKDNLCLIEALQQVLSSHP